MHTLARSLIKVNEFMMEEHPGRGDGPGLFRLDFFLTSASRSCPPFLARALVVALVVDGGEVAPAQHGQIQFMLEAG